MRAQTFSWKKHPTKARIYRKLPTISKTVAQRRARFTGHCFRAKDQVVSDLLLWILPCPRRGNRPVTYPDTLARATGFILNELMNLLRQRQIDPYGVTLFLQSRRQSIDDDDKESVVIEENCCSAVLRS